MAREQLGAAEMRATYVSISDQQHTENIGRETSKVDLPPNVIERRRRFFVYKSWRKAKKVRTVFFYLSNTSL